MKKWMAVTVLALLLTGCGTAAQRSELWQHDTMYCNKSWDHLMFSWFGYKNATVENAQEGSREGWWGIPVDVKK